MRILIILSCIVWMTTADPNRCCINNGPIQQNKCINNSSIWIMGSCPHHAYIVFANEFTITENDTITFSLSSGYQNIIPRDSYCLGSIEKTEEKIAMVCFSEIDSEVSEGQMSFLARLICSSISVVCLILTLAVYCILPNLRDLQGKCMMCTLFSLLMAFLLLSVVQQPIGESETTCIAIASLLYFWFMCVFFWLNVVSFNVWRSVVRPKLLSSKRYVYLLYNIYGWGGPLLSLIIVLICHHTPGEHIKPNFGIGRCWFSGTTSVRVFFYGPISLLLLINIAMFISTAWTLSTQNKIVTDIKHRSHKFKLWLYLKLFIIMGLCWVFEPMSELLFVEGSYVWIVTDYINSLQGLIIFCLLVVFRKRVRRDLARQGGVCCRRLPQEWAKMDDEICWELEEEVDELSSMHENNEEHVSRRP